MDNIFSDFKINLDKHPVSGDLILLTDGQSSSNSLRNLILSNFYERFYAPKKSGNLISLLFENPSPFTEKKIKQRVEEVVKNYEPNRINLLRVDIVYREEYDSYYISIIYKLKDIVQPIELPIILKRDR